MELRLLDLVRLAKVELGSFKIHLATGWPDPPLTAYFDGRFKEWQQRQNRRNFPCDHIVSLIHLRGSLWLFAGVWRVLGKPVPRHDTRPWFEYSTAEVSGLEHLTGRTVIAFERTFRASYLHGARYGDKLIIAQILEVKLSLGDFPGYASVLLRFDQLRHVVGRDLATWRAALASVAGVYLIADVEAGKLYVGSATGLSGIWGRWCGYAATGHGGNKELVSVLANRGATHAQHFQFSILEICDVLTPETDVLQRENHWKDALVSRKFGYNRN